MNKPAHILISRTDAIGDVVLTLPMAGYLKELFPGVKVSFLGRAYTGPVVNCSTNVDEYIDYTALQKMDGKAQVAYVKEQKIDAIIHVFPNKHVATLAQKAGIEMRIGTTNRIFHWFTCNKLVKLSRKKSDLHEAQLNLILLKQFGLKKIPPLADIIKNNPFKPAIALPGKFESLLDKAKATIIFHPKSHGSGVEWGLDNFKYLAELLPTDKYKIFITGSDKEQSLLSDWIKTLPENVTDLTGQMTLDELIAFIAKADGLIASGTGPVHLAAALGVNTIGLFPSVKPIHAGRWAPIGNKVQVLESSTADLSEISPEKVFQTIKCWK